MKIQCDVCERNAATVICCADEAALCAKCDVQVHAANKLASKHHRLQLHSLPTKLPSCDICQEKAAFIFCVEDRALFCQDCDESIHAVSTLAANHQRYLATGIRVALGCLSNCRTNNNNTINDSETAHEEDPPQLQFDDLQLLKQQQQQQQAAPPNNNNNNNLSPPGSWGVDDLLEFPDFDSPTNNNNKKGEALEIGEIEWWSDMNLFGEQMQMGQELAAEVPQLPMSSSSSSSIMGIQSCNNNNNNNNNNNGLLFHQQYRAAGGPTHKKPRIDISYRHDDDEYSIVPDLG